MTVRTLAPIRLLLATDDSPDARNADAWVARGLGRQGQVGLCLSLQEPPEPFDHRADLEHPWASPRNRHPGRSDREAQDHRHRAVAGDVIRANAAIAPGGQSSEWRTNAGRPCQSPANDRVDGRHPATEVNPRHSW